MKNIKKKNYHKNQLFFFPSKVCKIVFETNVFKAFVNILLCSNILAVQFLVGLAKFCIFGVCLETDYLVEVKNFLLEV